MVWNLLKSISDWYVDWSSSRQGLKHQEYLRRAAQEQAWKLGNSESRGGSNFKTREEYESWKKALCERREQSLTPEEKIYFGRETPFPKGSYETALKKNQDFYKRKTSKIVKIKVGTRNVNGVEFKSPFYVIASPLNYWNAGDNAARKRKLSQGDSTYWLKYSQDGKFGKQ